jgi:cytochrome c-type biogenesis protein CcmH
MLRILLFLILAVAATAQDPTERERALQNKLVAVCCWNESIAFHRSDTALQMRVELRQLIDQGRTDAEILDWFKTKYTGRVLMEPEGTKSAVAYALPVAAVAIGLFLVILLLRRWTRATPAPA